MTGAEALAEIIKATYEGRGMVVLDVEQVGTGIFRMQAMEGSMPREIVVTVMLHGVYADDAAER